MQHKKSQRANKGKVCYLTPTQSNNHISLNIYCNELSDHLCIHYSELLNFHQVAVKTQVDSCWLGYNCTFNKIQVTYHAFKELQLIIQHDIFIKSITLGEQGVARTGRNTTGPHCNRGAIFRQEAALRLQARRGVLQTTTTDTSDRYQSGPPTLHYAQARGPVIILQFSGITVEIVFTIYLKNCTFCLVNRKNQTVQESLLAKEHGP